jgi:PST family polysaccharide transporter
MNRDEIFSVRHLESNLKERSVKSAAVTIVAQGFKVVLQIGFIALLSRLLSPNDFGLIAMIAVVTALGMTLLDGGLSMATVQRATITHTQVSNLFWINISLGILLTLVVAAASPLMSWLYGEDSLLFPMLALSSTFLIGSFVVQHEAILKRRMQFKALSTIDLCSVTVGNTVGVIFAYKGFSYWSLVIATISTFVVRVVVTWCVVGWIPSFYQKSSEIGALVGFGANLTGVNFVNYLTNNITPFSIGIIGGANALGLFDRSFRLASIPKNQALMPVLKVLQSTLVRVAVDPQKLGNLTISLMSKLAVITFLISLVMFLSAEWIVLTLLGESWGEAIAIFKLLSIATIATPITTLTAMSLVAMGKAKALLKWKMITFSILLMALIIGSFWGMWGLLFGVTLSALFIRVPLFFIYAAHYLPIKAKQLFLAIVSPLLISLFLGLLFELFVINFLPSHSLVSIGLYVFFIPAVYIFLCLIIKSTRRDVIELVGLIRDNLKLSKFTK